MLSACFFGFLGIIITSYNSAAIVSSVPFGSGQMFDLIAQYYDRGNEFLSLGLHKSWKRDLLDEIRLNGRSRLLDLATGTADIAIMAASTYGCSVTGIDPSSQMLAVALQKGWQKNLNQLVKLEKADAQDLSFLQAESFDRVTISFGIRNVPNRMRALQESFRVLRKDGLLGILELTPPEISTWSGSAVALAVKTLVPMIGWLASGRAAEY
ncbi:methyltransferase, partial [Perkinsus sp. BL_2016]